MVFRPPPPFVDQRQERLGKGPPSSFLGLSTCSCSSDDPITVFEDASHDRESESGGSAYKRQDAKRKGRGKKRKREREKEVATGP